MPGATKAAYRAKIPWGQWARFAVLTAIALVMILPFLWQILTSFKPLSEVELGIWPQTWLPGNYAEVFRQVHFGRYYLNSVFVACWVTLLQVSTSALAAYAFSRLNWPGRDRVFLLYLATMMIPGVVLMIPTSGSSSTWASTTPMPASLCRRRSAPSARSCSASS